MASVSENGTFTAPLAPYPLYVLAPVFTYPEAPLKSGSRELMYTAPPVEYEPANVPWGPRSVSTEPTSKNDV